MGLMKKNLVTLELTEKIKLQIKSYFEKDLLTLDMFEQLRKCFCKGAVYETPICISADPEFSLR